MILLQVSGLAKSVYYYTLSKIDKDDKNKEIIYKIKEIFINNKERYGYRRITLELRNQGYNVNHKKVYRIMVKLGLKPLKRNKRKYSSYKGTVGKIADNLIERNFNAEKPNQKWYTDVTEFNLRGEKCYLSPILDGFNGEVISYNTSKSPNLEQINDMLNKAFDGKKLETSETGVRKLESAGKISNESAQNIRRYIRLTYLIPELLELVDNTVKYDKRTFLTMGIKPAVELSFLNKDEQNLLYASITYEDLTPSHAQAIRIRELSKKGKLNYKGKEQHYFMKDLLHQKINLKY